MATLRTGSEYPSVHTVRSLWTIASKKNYPQICFDLYMIKGTGPLVCPSLPNYMYKNFALKGSVPFCGLFYVK
jgi:hypothetical protein